MLAQAATLVAAIVVLPFVLIADVALIGIQRLGGMRGLHTERWATAIGFFCFLATLSYPVAIYAANFRVGNSSNSSCSTTFHGLNDFTHVPVIANHTITLHMHPVNALIVGLQAIFILLQTVCIVTLCLLTWFAQHPWSVVIVAVVIAASAQ